MRLNPRAKLVIRLEPIRGIAVHFNFDSETSQTRPAVVQTFYFRFRASAAINP
jgi:hypothetical protein